MFLPKIETVAEKLLKVVKRGHPGETSLDTTQFLTYELGDMIKMFIYRKLYKDNSYTVEAKIAMTDILAQCQIICARERWDFQEVYKLGRERCIERIERRLAHGE